MRDLGLLIRIAMEAAALLSVGGCVETPSPGTDSVVSSETEDD
jgi:hypothetical protein